MWDEHECKNCKRNCSPSLQKMPTQTQWLAVTHVLISDDDDKCVFAISLINSKETLILSVGVFYEWKINHYSLKFEMV